MRVRVGHMQHPLRVLCFGAAALCATAGVTGTTGIAATVVAAVGGIAAGELLARSRLRLWIIVVAALVLALGSRWVSGLCTSRELIPELVGPASALKLAAVLRFGGITFCLVAALRAIARRFPPAAVAELAAVAMAFALPFASHRGGVISRPLWLSDWAWRKGIDPSSVLIALGAGAAGVLVLLMALEAGRRVSLTSVFAVPVLMLVIVWAIRISPPPPPKPSNDLGLTHKTDGGKPPPPRPPRDDRPVKPDQWHGEGKKPQDQRDGDRGNNSGQQPVGPRPTPSDGSSGDGQGQPAPGQEGQGQGQEPKPPDLELDSPSDGNKAAPMAIALLGDDYVPRSQMYYFRQETWSDYVGSRLVPPRRSDVDEDTPRSFSTRRTRVDDDPEIDGEVLLHVDVALLVEHRSPFYLGTPVSREPVPNPNPKRFVRAYRFESVVSELDYPDLVGRAAGDPEWTDDQRAYYLAPPDDPRFAELGVELVADVPPDKLDDPFVKAAAVKLYLDKNFTYSTKHRHAGVPDPTADFLFGDRIGYCVHFAHAAVYIWRTLGIPARIGVGYAVDAEQAQGSAVLIRGGDAHAWPELYLDGVGWVVLDIAAETNLDPPGAPADHDMSQMLADMARGESADPFTDPPPEGNQTSLWSTLAAWLLAIAVVVLALFYAVKVWRRVAVRFCSPRALPRVGYRHALDVLGETGRTRRHGETREKFARRLAPEVTAMSRMTELNVSARFGPQPAPGQSRDEWRALLHRMQKELAATGRGGKRILAALNPFSFLTSR